MTIHRRVTKVIDGDTFKVGTKVNGSNYVRIANKDTPEKRQPGYNAAKQSLTRKIDHKVVTLTPVGRSYGRVVAEVRQNRKKI